MTGTVTHFNGIDAGTLAINGTTLTVTAAELNALSSAGLSTTELGYLDGVTAGTVTASKAVVVDANKDVGDLRNLDCTNLDAGASGTAGSVDIFPATASKGKLTLSCTNQTGDTAVTLNANAMGQATTVNIADPGAAASYIAQSTAALTLAEVDVLDAVTPGTAAASKAVVLDATKELAWAVTDNGSGTVTPLDFSLSATGAGASVDGAKFATATEVALGTYANGLNGKLDFGTAGSVTGLGGAICAELDLGPGTSSGSYAVFEGELNCPASGSLGTRTSFFSLNAWGANVAAVDTGGFLFDLNGLTAASGKLFNSGLSQAVTAAARLRVQVGGTTYYIPLCSNEALTA